MNKDQPALIVSFCNQISSPGCSLCILDISNRSSRWIGLSDFPDDALNGFAGVCGIFSLGEEVLIITQGQSSLLAAFNIGEAKVTGHVVLKKCKDPHSLVYTQGYAYVVSTGTNEIYRISYKDGQFGSEELFWRYPGVGSDKDVVHLNGLTAEDGDFIASCFGPKTTEGAWGMEGRIFHVESGRNIHSGLHQPHSPIISRSQLVFAESASFNVYLYKKTKRHSWKRSNEFTLNGYTRGLALREKSLWVGISASRKLSRSKGQFLYEGNLQESEILQLDLVTGQPVCSHSMSMYGREIYDICELSSEPDLHEEIESVSVRIKNMESWTDRYTADLNNLAKLAEQLVQYKRIFSEMVSVIIPTFNRAQFIEECIASVLSQTYTNLELIVVDDGSTDNTEELVTSITDPRLIYLRQTNRGRSNARNRALSIAKGKFITFLDSDDLYFPNKIELQVDHLNRNPGTGMVYTSAQCIDGHGRKIAHTYEATESGLIYEKIAFFTRVTITLPTVMTYKEVIDAVGGFDEKMHRFEDTDMWRRVSKYYRIDAITVYTCLLRTHDENSLLTQNPNQIVSALEYYAKKILEEDIDVDIAIRKKGIADLYFYYAQALRKVPRFSKEGRKLLRIANQYEPLIFRFMKFMNYRVYPGIRRRLIRTKSRLKRLLKK